MDQNQLVKDSVTHLVLDELPQVMKSHKQWRDRNPSFFLPNKFECLLYAAEEMGEIFSEIIRERRPNDLRANPYETNAQKINTEVSDCVTMLVSAFVKHFLIDCKDTSFNRFAYLAGKTMYGADYTMEVVSDSLLAANVHLSLALLPEVSVGHMRHDRDYVEKMFVQHTILAIYNLTVLSNKPVLKLVEEFEQKIERKRLNK